MDGRVGLTPVSGHCIFLFPEVMAAFPGLRGGVDRVGWESHLPTVPQGPTPSPWILKAGSAEDQGPRTPGPTHLDPSDSSTK